jgi:hypothetical protein
MNLPVEFTGNQVDIAIRQRHRADACRIARSEREIDVFDRLLLGTSAGGKE